MALDYRYVAKQRLAKASELLATNDDDNLIYACLELRKCVEALAYDLLTAYLHAVPLTAFEVWQPDKVMRELMQVDPRADRSARISMQREATEIEPAGPWQEIGEDRRLKASRLTKIFHQLGNALHTPTIRQMKEAKPPDYANLRKTAEEIRKEFDHVLSAKIWNAHFSVSVTVNCTECGTPIKRESSYLDTVNQIQCGGCGQHFKVEHEAGSTDYYFESIRYYWYCEGCGAEREIAESKAKPGLDVSCPKCKTPAVLAEVINWRVKQTPPDKNTSSSRLMRLRAGMTRLYGKLWFRKEKLRGVRGTSQGNCW